MKNKGKIFVPFIDGTLNYDCGQCGYDCCQEAGWIVVNTKEKQMLLQRYPFLRYFLVKETKTTHWIRRVSECWFLESSGLCYIQKKYGYSSKPFMCRLHPFYVARCRDEYVVLPEMCPNLHVDKGSKNKNVSYKRIFKNAKEAIEYGVVWGQIDWRKRRLDLERKILEDSKMFLDRASYLDFSAYQISIANKNQDMREIKSELLESVELWKCFFGIDELDMENKRLAYELTAITSLLRTGSSQLRQMDVKKVPLALLALYFYMILFSKNRSVKTYVETYKNILSDISSKLLFLKKDDLKIKNRSIEAKLRYLRLLQEAHIRKLKPKAKKTERKR